MTEISKEYAEALFELACENGESKEVSDGLKFILNIFEENRDYFAFLTSPGISKKDRIDSIGAIFGSDVPECLVSFLSYMCQRGKLRYFAGAAAEYERMYTDSKNALTVFVTSAVQLNESEKKRLSDALEKKYGKTVLISYAVDETLIGGMKLETGGFIFDGSVKKKLHELKEVIDK